MRRSFIALACMSATAAACVSPAHATRSGVPTACLAAPLVPLAIRDLEPTTLHYQGTFATAGQTMAITSTLVVTPHSAGGWAVVERAMLPRGIAVDSARLAARSLVPLERTIRQGPMQTALVFANDRATGTMTVGGQARPITAELCGPLVGDGAGAFLVIGRLPLADGYHAILRHFDIQHEKETVRRLAVVGSERTTVPAGSFDTWKVEVSEEGGAIPTAIWVDKSSLAPVKFSSSQGTVTVTMELTK